MKKLYVVPNVDVTSLLTYDILATSTDEIATERYNYLCPYIPETRCREYNHFVRQKNGVLSSPSDVDKYHRISVNGKDDCPYKADCVKYAKYCRLTNGKQR